MRKAKIIISSIVTISLASYIFLNQWSKASDTSTYNSNVGNAPTIIDPSDDTVDLGKNNSGNYTYIPPVLEYDNKEDKQDGDIKDMDTSGSHFTPATEIDLDPTSITVLVNQELALPKDYVPANMVVPNIPFDIKRYDDKMLMREEAAKAIEELFAAAEKEGHKLYGISGYRSYKRQYDIFTSNLVKNGKTRTIKYSAVPGASEHQTGLAMDVSLKSLRYRLVTSFSSTPEGKWLADNAHKYGYILRYSKDKTKITGYAYEPWHIRFVGKDLANYLYTNNLTLEEYYNYIPSEDFDFEKEYAEILNFKPTPTPSPTPIAEEELEEENADLENPDGQMEDGLDEDNGDTMDENDIDVDNNNEDTMDEGNQDDNIYEDDLDNDDLDEENSDENIIDENIIDEDIPYTDDMNPIDSPEDLNGEPIIINPNTGKPVVDIYDENITP